MRHPHVLRKVFVLSTRAFESNRATLIYGDRVHRREHIGREAVHRHALPKKWECPRIYPESPRL
jgi:hypothetical protein